MTYRFHPEAQTEYIEATAYYRGIRIGLAEAFVGEIERGIESILAFPEAYPAIEEDVRRYVTRRFPFGILYTIEDDGSLFIVAVMHLRRRPGYWRGREVGG